METTATDHVNLAFPADRLSEVVEFYVDTLGFTTGFDDPGLFRVDFGHTYSRR